MKLVTFEEIRNEIIQNFRRMSLIPCLGSGFTSNCTSYNGRVPSGKSYKEYMINELFSSNIIPLNERESFKYEKFSNVSDIYNKNIPIHKRKKYLIDNFTQVKISNDKKNFLSLSWPYVYTLNIDDAIENGAEFTVVYSNRPVDDSIFDRCKCVIKLHGDVTEIIAYNDSESEIFANSQYRDSIISNQQLLNRFAHDSQINNLIFIGCSLDDELDLSVYLKPSTKYSNSRYFVTCEKPTIAQRNTLENYGITHCVLFDSFDDIYRTIFEAGIEATKIKKDDLVDFSIYTQICLDDNYEDNKPFLFQGKELIDKKENSFTIPYFLIQRKSMQTVLNTINDYPLQIINGHSFCGKTYSLSELASRIKDRNVFYFASKERLTDSAFSFLLSQKNSVVIADCNVLSKNQFEVILNNLVELREYKTTFIIGANYKDNDIMDIIRLYTIQNKITKDSIPITKIENRLTSLELGEINHLLASVGGGIFNSKFTIIDNVIEMAKTNSENHIFQETTPSFETYKSIASLIILATKRKVYSKDAIVFDLLSEFENQCKLTTPLIESERTLSYEVSASDNSPIKYVVYAEQWLLMQLAKFAEHESHHLLIIEAYKYIVNRVILHYGNLEVLRNNKFSKYKEFILFDNINSLFFSVPNASKGLSLIRNIYESLNELLSVDPNYMHQRSKCYIKSSLYENSLEEKKKYLSNAFRDSNVAIQIFQQRYDACGNKKLLISIAHLTYTQALILCHKCVINEFMNIDENTEALIKLYEALNSEYNSYDYAKNDSFNFGNVIQQVITKAVEEKTLFHNNAYEIIGNLLKCTMKG